MQCHRDAEPALRQLKECAGWRGIDADAPTVVLGREHHRLHEKMAICQGGEAKFCKAGDPAAFVLMPPVPPKHALPQVQNSAMSEPTASIELQQMPIDRQREMRPVRHLPKAQTRPGFFQ